MEKEAKSTAKSGGVGINNNSKIRVADSSSTCLIGPRWCRL